MLDGALAVGLQDPSRKLGNVSLNPVAVLLDGCSVAGALAPAVKDLLAVNPLLLLHNLACFYQHLSKNVLVLQREKLVVGVLDLAVQLTHPLQGLCGGGSVSALPELLLLV